MSPRSFRRQRGEEAVVVDRAEAVVEEHTDPAAVFDYTYAELPPVLPA